MKAGKLKHLVTIQTPQKTQTASGDTATTWIDFDQVYAEVIPMNGVHDWHADTMNPDITHRVRIRYLSGLTADMRILHGSRILQIEVPPANHEELGKEIFLLCVEQT